MDSEKARNDYRVSKPQVELQDFYNSVFPRIDALCDYIDQYTLDAMPQSAATLLQLGLMLMELSPAVEVYHQPDVPNAIDFDRYNILTPNDPINIID